MNCVFFLFLSIVELVNYKNIVYNKKRNEVFMKINDTFITTLPPISMDGKFKVIQNRQNVWVNQGIENEKVEIKITKRIKEGYVGEIVRVIEPSIYRKANDCKIKKCGGCDFRYIQYDQQLKIKKKMIENELQENKLSLQVKDVVGMESPYAYRNKVILTFQKNKKQVNMGFYEENSHYVVNIPSCFNHDELTNQLASTLLKLVEKFHIEIYDEDRKTGILRHVLIRRAVVTNQTLVCLVVAQSQFKGSRNFVNELIKQCPFVTTVVMNTNSRSTSVVLGNDEKVIVGKGFIVDELCGHTYRISASSFYQINHDQTEKLYSKAIELAQLKPQDIVYDMYCGIGTIGMSMAHQVKEVVGVEINRQAIEDAKMNAKMNRLHNVSFVCEDATTFMQKKAMKHQKVDVVFMDPPRSGSTHEFMDGLVEMNPKKIVYISCNPQTQIKDLNYLKKKGYIAHEMYLYDMFPMSCHIETIVLLSKRNMKKAY